MGAKRHHWNMRLSVVIFWRRRGCSNSNNRALCQDLTQFSASIIYKISGYRKISVVPAIWSHSPRSYVFNDSYSTNVSTTLNFMFWWCQSPRFICLQILSLEVISNRKSALKNLVQSMIWKFQSWRNCNRARINVDNPIRNVSA